MNMFKNCDFCGEKNTAIQQQGLYLDDGWSIELSSLGHYGGFTDLFSKNNLTMHMCHDCCLKMINLFPMMSNVIGSKTAYHPNRNSSNSQHGIEVPPCCRFAWTFSDTADGLKQHVATSELLWSE